MPAELIQSLKLAHLARALLPGTVAGVPGFHCLALHVLSLVAPAQSVHHYRIKLPRFDNGHPCNCPAVWWSLARRGSRTQRGAWRTRRARCSRTAPRPKRAQVRCWARCAPALPVVLYRLHATLPCSAWHMLRCRATQRPAALPSPRHCRWLRSCPGAGHPHSGAAAEGVCCGAGARCCVGRHAWRRGHQQPAG